MSTITDAVHTVIPVAQATAPAVSSVLQSVPHFVLPAAQPAVLTAFQVVAPSVGQSLITFSPAVLEAVVTTVSPEILIAAAVGAVGTSVVAASTLSHVTLDSGSSSRELLNQVEPLAPSVETPFFPESPIEDPSETISKF